MSARYLSVYHNTFCIFVPSKPGFVFRYYRRNCGDYCTNGTTTLVRLIEAHFASAKVVIEYEFQSTKIPMSYTTFVKELLCLAKFMKTYNASQLRVKFKVER
jgi:hypothetical protein